MNNSLRSNNMNFAYFVFITTIACRPLATIKAVSDPFNFKKPTNTIIKTI